MENTINHASLSLTVSKHDPLDPGTATMLQLTGCKECLRQAITKMLLHHEGFKGLINECIRAANDIKAKSQN